MQAETVDYQFDGISVRPAAFTVTRAGQAVALEPKAFRTLLYLIEHRDRAVGKEELIESVWEGAAVTDNALTRIVAQIRRELGDDAHHPRFIQTLPTIGYRFIAAVQVVPPAAPRTPHSPVLTTRSLAAGAMALLLLALGAWLLIPRGGVAMKGDVPSTQFTTAAGLDITGSFSPDGRSFAFSSNRSGRFEIYVQPASPGGVARQITSDGMQNLEPAWSPDGAWIAYHSVVRRGIWLASMTGGANRRISSFGSAPSWSPDGTRIAFQGLEPSALAPFDRAGPGDPTIWTVARDGSELRQITTQESPPGSHAMPSWAPDGKRIVFVAHGGSDTIWIVEAASGRLARTPMGSPYRVEAPLFDRTGRTIYFGGARGTALDWPDFGIYRLALSGATEEPVKLLSTRAEVPLGLALSPDGTGLLYSSVSHFSQIWTSTIHGESARPMHADSIVRAFSPGFSPDGRKLLFLVRTVGVDANIWVMNMDGGLAIPVVSDPGYKAWPAWSADGRAIQYSYYPAREHREVEFRQVNPDDGASRVLSPLAAPPPGVVRTRLMPDGKDFLEERGSPVNIWIRPRHGEAARQLTFEREGATFPFPSWDGQWIAYEVKRGDTVQVAVVDRGGTHPEILTADAAIEWPQSWAADNRRIACSGYRDGAWNLFWIDRVTRERKPITRNTDYGVFLRSAAWRPGTEQIAYEYSRVKGNVYRIRLP